jgi:eukaryotic-like serine/threonine-protein kinase
MGTVFMGIDDASGQTAAIKLLAAEMAQQSDFRERFKAEIETLRKLNHPNIVQIFGFGEEDGQIYYAMEFVAGSSLEEQLGRGRVFSWREVAHFGIAVARALRHAHDRGVIHRDIKPGNLLLTEDGTLKLSDFGIARLFGNARLTGAGSVLGTAEFMAPEQADGRAVDPRSDLYSLGAVLYVLLARRPLFNARSLLEMLGKQRTENPAPLRQFAADVPVELEQIIHRLLDKDPDRRFGTATVLERRLETMLESFELNPPAESVHVMVEPVPAGSQAGIDRPIDPLALTVASTQPPTPAASIAPSAGSAAPPESDSSAGDAPAGENCPSPALESPERTTARFVPVQPGELDRSLPERPPEPWISPQTWALMIGLLAVLLLAWYLLQPPSADALYRRIERQTESQSTEALMQAEEDIQQFLNRFPDDPRSDRLKDNAERIEITRLERRLELQAKGLQVQTSLSPVERIYIEALNTARIDAEAGIAKFQAMIDLFDSPNGTSGSTGRCIELAKRRLSEFRKDYEPQTQAQRTVIAKQLDRADELRKSAPQRAEKVYRAVLELYQNKAWAKSLVERARLALAMGKHKNQILNPKSQTNSKYQSRKI